ncbi:hypothetical protein MCBRY_003009 [Methylocystis bryophila]|uniref:Uncharacterized protein n=1 Tax=Methylocystis bryophila TaxID=655015 RepID=A0A1W6MWU2_9HYPH|nr:hypothetical protein B1812_14410 [Methylocystis bryophila]
MLADASQNHVRESRALTLGLDRRPSSAYASLTYSEAKGCGGRRSAETRAAATSGAFGSTPARHDHELAQRTRQTLQNALR